MYIPKLNLKRNDKPMKRPNLTEQFSLVQQNYNIVGPKQDTSDVQPGLGPISDVPKGKVARCTV